MSLRKLNLKTLLNFAATIYIKSSCGSCGDGRVKYMGRALSIMHARLTRSIDGCNEVVDGCLLLRSSSLLRRANVNCSVQLPVCPIF